MNWLFAWSFNRRGLMEESRSLRRAALDQLREGSFGEYYEPVTGDALGSRDQSWTAAAALDLLLARDWAAG
jgi:glycogen debranching enzyme